MENLGTFIQGQVIKFQFELTAQTGDSDDLYAILNYGIYIALYGQEDRVKRIYSTDDGSIKRYSLGTEVTLYLTLTADITKSMHGDYRMEMMVRKDDNTYAALNENNVRFYVDRRKIAEDA